VIIYEEEYEHHLTKLDRSIDDQIRPYIALPRSQKQSDNYKSCNNNSETETDRDAETDTASVYTVGATTVAESKEYDTEMEYLPEEKRVLLRRIAFLKLTAIIERHKPDHRRLQWSLNDIYDDGDQQNHLTTQTLNRNSKSRRSSRFSTMKRAALNAIESADRKASAVFSDKPDRNSVSSHSLSKNSQSSKYSTYNTRMTVPAPNSPLNNPSNPEESIFGVSLKTLSKRNECSGYLPNVVEGGMIWLRMHALDTGGVFRKSGVKSRIQMLCNRANQVSSSGMFNRRFSHNHENSDARRYHARNAFQCFEMITRGIQDLQPYDVADFLKKWYRELPEPLIPSKLSEQIAGVIEFIPRDENGSFTLTRKNRKSVSKTASARKSISAKNRQNLKKSSKSKFCAENDLDLAIKCALVLLTEENRYTLRALLGLLNDTAGCSSENQMTAQNLAVCWAPSLFSSNVCHNGDITAQMGKMSQMAKISTPKSSKPAKIQISSPVVHMKKLQISSPVSVGENISSKLSSSFNTLPSQKSHNSSVLSTMNTMQTTDTVSKLVDCLSFMINHHEKLFKISDDLCDVGLEVIG